jgi:hypothetical protein
MSSVMPSQVVLVIEKFFSHVTRNTPGEIHSTQLDSLQGIVNLIREIPSELINVSLDQYANMVLAMATIEEQGKLRIGRGTSFQLPAIKGVDVATVLYLGVRYQVACQWLECLQCRRDHVIIAGRAVLALEPSNEQINVRRRIQGWPR